ncbi:MAG TPA: hypothetical protein VFZ48_04485 [Candidatus Saccharimonadales bacterium]
MSEDFLGVVKKREFWRGQRYLFVALPVVASFWIFQIMGVLGGRSPLIAWMISAGIAVVIMFIMTLDALNNAPRQALFELHGLLLQLGVILVGNAAVVTLQLLQGVQWQPLDTVIVCMAISGALVVIALGKSRSHPIASPWPRCGLTLSLKCLPQLFQAWPLLFVNGGLHLFAVVALFAQGILRFWPAAKARRQAEGAVAQEALFVATAVDLLTIVVVCACYGVGVAGWLR